jgi:hypothetical protein
MSTSSSVIRNHYKADADLFLVLNCIARQYFPRPLGERIKVRGSLNLTLIPFASLRTGLALSRKEQEETIPRDEQGAL